MDRSAADLDDTPHDEVVIGEAVELKEQGAADDVDEGAKGDGEDGGGENEDGPKRRRRMYAMWVAYVGSGYHVSVFWLLPRALRLCSGGSALRRLVLLRSRCCCCGRCSSRPKLRTQPALTPRPFLHAATAGPHRECSATPGTPPSRRSWSARWSRRAASQRRWRGASRGWVRREWSARLDSGCHRKLCVTACEVAGV
jgi:hypothetical protein